MKFEIVEEDPEFDDDILLDKTPDSIKAVLGFDPLDWDDDEEDDSEEE